MWFAHFSRLPSATGWRDPCPRSRVDGQCLGGVQGDTAAPQRGDLRQVPAGRVYQAQAVVRAGPQQHAGDDPGQADPVRQLH